MFNRFFEKHTVGEYSFRSDLFPTVEDRAFWDAYQNEECVSLAAREINYAWPIVKATDFMAFKINGDRTVMQKPYDDRRNHLHLFVYAELKENKGRFLPQIVNGLFTTCEESFWGLSAHYMDKTFAFPYIPTPAEPYIDLCAAETAEFLAVTVTLLRKPLEAYCPEIIDRVLYELNRRIKEPYETRLDFAWMGHGHRKPNNWTVFILANVLTVFLLTEKEERRRARAIRKIMLEAQNYYNTIPNDGGCDEGVSYWNMAGASLFEIVYQLKQATDGALDLFDDEKLGRIAAYMKKAHIAADRFIVVADGSPSPRSGGLLYWFAKETGQTELMNFAAALYQKDPDPMRLLSHTCGSFRRCIYYSDMIREMEAYSVSYPLHGAVEYLPELEIAGLRRGELFLFAKGGNNDEQHNHNDVGSFAFYDGTTPVLVDVGIGVYNRYTFEPETRYTLIPWTRAMNHNIPLINGVEQREGDAFRADEFSVEEGKAEISFADAYPKEAGVASVRRTLTLNENGVTCTDRFAFAGTERNAVCEVLMSVLPVRIENNTAILGEKYRISADCGKLAFEFLPFEDEKLEREWKCDGVARITVSLDGAEHVTLTVEKI